VAIGRLHLKEMKWLFPLIFLIGCAEIRMPTPVSLPSICMGEEFCEDRKAAETLAAMGFADAGLIIMCSNPNVRNILEVECGSDALQYP